MADTKIVSCIDCGVDVEVHKKHGLSNARCPTHREAYFESKKEHRKEKRRAAGKRYREKLKREGRNSTSYDCVCLMCGTEFKGRRPKAKLCSPKCTVDHNVQKLEGRTLLLECVDCGAKVEMPWSTPRYRVRCETHRETHRERMKKRHQITRKNVKRIELGESPYEDYIVVGPVWCSQPGNYGWRVTAKHLSNPNRREMSLAHYNLSVKLGRRVQDREGIVFLDGDVDNCDSLNLLLETENKKEVA